jgi:hypothetical protein
MRNQLEPTPSKWKNRLGNPTVVFSKKFLLSCLLALVILLTGCEQKPSLLPPGSKFGFDTWLDIFNERAEKLVESRNHPALIDELGLSDLLERELERVFLAYPDYEARLRDTYLSRHQGIVVVDSWNWEPVPAGTRWTSDHPVTEYHWLKSDYGSVSHWQVMFGQELHEAAGSPLDQEMLRDYASAWSSGGTEAVMDLYARDAVRYEPLLWNNKYGLAQIEEFANNYFTEYPDTPVELIQSFGDLTEASLVGGVYTIRVKNFWRTCDIRELVIFKLDEDKIATEWVFYQGDTLIDCGWVR